MEEFLYQESKYIKRQDLKDYTDLLLNYEFMPTEISNDFEDNIVFQYFVNLTKKAPDFLKPYEYALSMLDLLEPDEELIQLEKELEVRLIEACERVAKKEKIFNQQVPWAWMENKPLIRGLYRKAENLWKDKDLEKALDLFTKIYNTNENDNIGVRYSIKAISEGMSFEEFERRFINENGETYIGDKLWEWYGEV